MDNYKIWRSKQTSGFCGTRVQVSLYSGEAYPDKRCPNCRAQETNAHLMRCLDEDSTRLLIDNVDKLTRWLEMDGTTHPELLYLIPYYILMRNDKPFSQLGHMSPQMRSLAESQDKIGWRNFTKGYILTHFYKILNFHLAMTSNYFNRTDWTKQFNSKISK
jgi:hypothetical protein